jgi:hypothetical protein
VSDDVIGGVEVISVVTDSLETTVIVINVVFLMEEA